MSGDCDICGSYDHVETKCDAGQPDDPTGPRMVIYAVPASIPRARIAEWLTSLGIDPDKVERGGILGIGPEAVRCRVFAEDPDGQIMFDEFRDFVMHDVCIPITEDR